MDSKIYELELVYRGQTRLYVLRDQGPVTRPQPIGGLRVFPGEYYIYVVHDNLTLGFARTLTDKIKLMITNELFVPRRYYWRADVQAWRVDQYSKIKFWPEELPGGWYPYFFSGMTQRQHGLFNESGFGWRDAKANEILALVARVLARVFKRTVMGFRPDGVNIYNFLLPGGTLLRKAFEWKQWTIFICQDTDEPPQWLTYDDRPDAVFKQGVCGHNANKQSFYGSINQHQGDLFVPTACPGGQAAILTSETRPVPSLPLDTVLDGVLPVTFVEFCFKNSEIYGKTTDGDWYYVLEQRAKNGNQKDYVLHVPASLFPALPVPCVDWQLV